MELLPHVELVTGADPTGTVIWMHGLGADGWDFVPIVREIPLPEDLALRFIFPHAPVRPVTINNGMEMRAWYDIAMMNDISRQPDERSIRESQGMVEELITRESQRGIDPDHIVLAGFSQGGAIALFAGLRHPQRLAGLVALSTYLVGPDLLAVEASAANRDVPVFMAHGTRDPMVQYPWGVASRDTLASAGWSVEWHEYPMEHSAVLEEIVAAGDFIRRVLAAAD